MNALVTIAASCWIALGQPPSFGSVDQLRELAKVDAPECETVALAWSTTQLPNRRSVLLWDRAAAILFRVHIDPMPVGVRWEGWRGASVSAVRADDPSDGFDLPGYSSGSGRPPLSSGMRELVATHGGAAYAALR